MPLGSCAGMIKHHWPTRFPGQPDATRAVALAARTYELSEFWSIAWASD